MSTPEDTVSLLIHGAAIQCEAAQLLRELMAERDALALQVLVLTNERDEARALGRMA